MMFVLSRFSFLLFILVVLVSSSTTLLLSSSTCPLFVSAFNINNFNNHFYNGDRNTYVKSKVKINDHDTGNEGITSDCTLNRRKVLQTATTAAAASCSSASGLWLPSTIANAEETKTSTMKINPVTTLSNDEKTKFPLVSFGLQIYNDDVAYTLTSIALEVGYRNFFASVLAGNQRGFARAIKNSGIDRNELFICGSVVSNRVAGYDAAKKETTKGWHRNMDCFAVGDIDYLDQIMLDYPGPDSPSILGQWSSFEEMYRLGLTKTLAVSNFSSKQLDCILNRQDQQTESKLIRPVVNQLPYSVAYRRPDDVIEQNTDQRNVLVQAWAPLGGSLGGRFDSNIKSICAKIGAKYNKSFAQVALRYIIQSGASFTTQSKKKEHFEENLNIFDFELTADEMNQLSKLAA